MDKVIIYICHTRGSDDVLEIYQYSVENLEKVKSKCRNVWKGGTVKHYGDFDYEFGFDSDYYSACEVRDVESI